MTSPNIIPILRLLYHKSPKNFYCESVKIETQSRIVYPIRNGKRRRLRLRSRLPRQNRAEVVREQRSVITMYKRDIACYDPEEKLYWEDTIRQMP